MTEDEWEERYLPRKNHIEPNAPRCGDMFETFGEELQFVREQQRKFIWTWIEGDGGHSCIVSGYHWVNRLGYFVCEKLWEEEFVEIRLDW